MDPAGNAGVAGWLDNTMAELTPAAYSCELPSDSCLRSGLPRIDYPDSFSARLRHPNSDLIEMYAAILGNLPRIQTIVGWTRASRRRQTHMLSATNWDAGSFSEEYG